MGREKNDHKVGHWMKDDQMRWEHSGRREKISKKEQEHRRERRRGWIREREKNQCS